MKRSNVVASAAIALAVAATQPSSAETVTYTYDALGRLVTSSVSSGPSNGVQTSIQYDAAGNRTNYQVQGAPVVGSSGATQGAVIANSSTGNAATSASGGAKTPPVIPAVQLILTSLNGFTLFVIQKTTG